MRHFAVVLLLGLGALTACDDSTGLRFDPQLVTDTVEVAVPSAENSDLPTALDVAASAGRIGGGRFPQRAGDAEAWDFALRRRDGEVALVPAAALGLNSRASITRALLNETFDSLAEAPGRSAFFTDSAAVLQQGSVYAARSRITSGGFGGCQQYAKLQPLEVNREQGRVRLQITTNQRCGDPRLALED